MLPRRALQDRAYWVFACTVSARFNHGGGSIVCYRGSDAPRWLRLFFGLAPIRTQGRPRPELVAGLALVAIHSEFCISDPTLALRRHYLDCDVDSDLIRLLYLV